jgi:hypothetical protein
MANVSQYLSKALLDWSLGGATPTRPAAWGIGLSLGSPTSVSGSEITTGSGYARQTGIFGAAGTPTSSGTGSNNSACTFGPFSGAASVSGLQLWDSMLSLNSGNMLYEGLLATARTIGVGDSLVLNVGALIIGMS